MSGEGSTHVEQHVNLPPMIFGRIRWANDLGAPTGLACDGFTILVEERTPTEYQDGPAGIKPKPGTGRWRTHIASAPCRQLPAEDGHQVIEFDVPDVRLTVFDGKYRVTPSLRGRWTTPIQQIKGSRFIYPLSWIGRLTEADHVKSLEFEILTTRRFF